MKLRRASPSPNRYGCIRARYSECARQRDSQDLPNRRAGSDGSWASDVPFAVHMGQMGQGGMERMNGMTQVERNAASAAGRQ